MITDFLAAGTPHLRPSAAETARFGISVSRLVVPLDERVNASTLDEIVGGCRADLLILRCASQAPGISDWLYRSHEWRHLHADTLLYFSRELSDIAIDGGTFVGDVVDPEQLSKLTRRTFESYRNHYSSNPLLPRSAVREGYSEWLSTLMSDSATRTFVAVESDAYVSFVVACDLPREGSGEIVLNGTHPDHESRGHYSRLVARALQSFRATGAEKVWISTQASNRRVIRAWIRLGFNFEYSIDTYHLMPATSAD